jgi:hypothetical protein
VPGVLGDEEFEQLIRLENDVFKLAIRGHAAIETELDAALMEAFVGEAPSNIRALGGFKTRLALAVGLGIIPGRHKTAIEAIAKVRHDFAHGAIRELTPKRARALLKAYGHDIEEFVREVFDTEDPIDMLRVVLVMAHGAIKFGREAERRRREAVQRALAVQKAVREQISALRKIVEPSGEGP